MSGEQGRSMYSLSWSGSLPSLCKEASNDPILLLANSIHKVRLYWIHGTFSGCPMAVTLGIIPSRYAISSRYYWFPIRVRSSTTETNSSSRGIESVISKTGIPLRHLEGRPTGLHASCRKIRDIPHPLRACHVAASTIFEFGYFITLL